MKSITEIIKSRRAIYPPNYQAKQIPKEVIRKILEAANWAPTHKRTEPWRFKVFYDDAKVQLANWIGKAMEQYAKPGKFDPAKQQKMINKVTKSSCVLAICMQRDPAERLPEWEEIASVACAVQNMWLLCTDYGIGAYWSSPSFITNHPHEFLKLADGERCLGLFYMGWQDKDVKMKALRSPIGQKVIWM